MRYLCDSNVWIATVLMSHPHHPRARHWVENLNENDEALFCRATQKSFLRLLTTEAWMKEETQTNAQAILIFQELQKFPWFRFFHEEPEGLEKTWWKLAGVRQNAPKLWMDSYLAAFAITKGVQLVTFDRGFQRYIKNDLDLLLLNEPSL